MVTILTGRRLVLALIVIEWIEAGVRVSGLIQTHCIHKSNQFLTLIVLTT